MVFKQFDIYPLGDTALVVKFGDNIDVKTHQKIRALSTYLEANPFMGLRDILATYTTVTVFYEPALVQLKDKLDLPYMAVKRELDKIANELRNLREQEPRVVAIPVCYGGEHGPDLDYVAEHNDLSLDEVVSIHAGGEYLVYMIGFAPGFPYLGGLSQRIATPRRKSPRLAIPAGSVGIAGQQTGVYPIETPGGWQIIGQTPLALFRPLNDPPSLLQSGDIIKFEPITAKEFVKWGNKLNDN